MDSTDSQHESEGYSTAPEEGEDLKHNWNWVDPGDHRLENLVKRVPTLDPQNHERKGAYWIRSAALGTGGFGSTNLWVLRDKVTGNALDRIAVKSVHLSKRKWYADWKQWYDWPRRDIPAEVAALRVVNKAVASPYIIRYRGYRVFSAERAYRIAMPMAEFGDMTHTIVDWYNSHQLRGMPKAFALDIFAALVTASQLMVSRNVLHNDLKDPNVLFQAAEPGDLAEFANFLDEDARGWGIRPVISDFGLAYPMMVEGTDFQNPRHYFVGTPGYKAPEQCYVELSTKSVLPNTNIGEKAVVFSFGATMFWLMHAKQEEATNGLTQFREGNFSEGRDPEERVTGEATNERPLVVAHSQDLYKFTLDRDIDDRKHVKWHFDLHKNNLLIASKGLRRLILKCPRFRPEDRPTLAQLLEFINIERQGTKVKQNPKLFEGMEHKAMDFPRMGQPFNASQVAKTEDFRESESDKESGDDLYEDRRTDYKRNQPSDIVSSG